MMRIVIAWLLMITLLGSCREAFAWGSLIPGREHSPHAAQREALRNERLYERVVADRLQNPVRFDRLHPILGDLLTNRSTFEYWYNRWQAAPARFEHWHPYFWRIIAGEALAGGPPVVLPPVVLPPAPPLIPPAGQEGNPPVISGPLPPAPPNPPVQPPSVAAVPEPGSFVLVVEALALAVLARGGLALLRPKRQ